MKFFFRRFVCIAAACLALSTLVLADEPAVSAKAAVTITLNRTSLKLAVGETAKLTATVRNSGKTVAWKSSDKSVATVGTNGKVTACAVGSAVITAKAGGKSASCKVTVTKWSDLQKYYRKPYDTIVKKFPDGEYVTQYAEYNYYTYKKGIGFAFPKPVAVQSKSPAGMITLTRNVKRYSLLGVRIGMKRATAFSRLKVAGFTRTSSVGNISYWNGSDYRQVMLEADQKVKMIRYGAW